MAGKLLVSNTVTAIYDKGSGALVCTEARAVDPETREIVVSSTSAAFIVGEGGFGGERGPSATTINQDREPDIEIRVPTRPDQALLYRLSGDRNPLHSDPSFAARAGLAHPILHGLCTYGITGRVLLNAGCGGDTNRIRAMSARFTRPVVPGETLMVKAWRDGERILFRTLGPEGEPVLDYGVLTLNPNKQS